MTPLAPSPSATLDGIAISNVGVEVVSHVGGSQPPAGHVLALVRYTETNTRSASLPCCSAHLRCGIELSGRTYRETSDSFDVAAMGGLEGEQVIREIPPGGSARRLTVIDLPRAAVIGREAVVVFRPLHGRGRAELARITVRP